MNSPKAPNWRISQKMRTHARSLRRDQTDAEKIIWSALRAHRLGGVAFRRQTPIGPYIADFVSHSARLIIEVDGGQHFEPEHEVRDRRRDAFFASKGFRTLRFNNHDVMTNRNGVFEMITTELAATPSPTLPRKRGRESTTGGNA